MNKTFLEQMIVSCEAILLEEDPQLTRLHARAIKHMAEDMLQDVEVTEAVNTIWRNVQQKREVI